MSQLYDIYKRETFALARTLVLKLDLINEVINKELKYTGVEVNEERPYTHKYYLNLAGEYHDVDRQRLLRQTGKDTMTIVVASESGNTEVPFTKSLFHGSSPNLTLLNEYQIGTSYYNSLVKRYPEYETLIKGIIHPIPLETVLNAPDGTILSLGYRVLQLDENNEVHSYQLANYVVGNKLTKLIEPNEYNLISKTQEWITKTIFRWLNKGYTLTDDLYLAYFLGVLYVNLPSKIMNIRLANTHTAMTHSFHVREFLESHGMLGKYTSFIPLEQVIYLYRNVRYLELNMGKTFTFHELIDNLLTPTGIPIAGYDFRHDLSEIDGVKQLLPESKMYREHLNFKNIGSSTDVKSVRYVLDAQKALARDNDKYLDDWELRTQEKMSYGGDDNLITKVLESEMFAISDPVPVELLSMLLWMWAYTASEGFYTGHIFISSPISDENIVLSPKNAFILWLYAINKGAQRVTLKTVPNDLITVMYLPRTNDGFVGPEGYPPLPSLPQLMTKVDMNYVTKERLATVMSQHSPNYFSSSPTEFHRNVTAMYDELVRQWFASCRTEDMYARGYTDYVFKRQYWHNVPIRLTDTDISYEKWLIQLGLDFTGYEERDYVNLAERLVVASIGGQGEHEFTRSQMQKSMMEIMRHFSSYLTHYIYSTNETAVTSGTGKYPRMTNITTDGDASIYGGLDIGLELHNNQTTGEAVNYLTTFGPDVSNIELDVDVIHSGTLPLGLSILSTSIVVDQAANAIDYTVLDVRFTGEAKKVYDPLPAPPAPSGSFRNRYLVTNPYPIYYTDDMVSITPTISAVPANSNGAESATVAVHSFKATPPIDHIESASVTVHSFKAVPQLGTTEPVEMGVANVSAIPVKDYEDLSVVVQSFKAIPELAISESVTIGITQFSAIPVENLEVEAFVTTTNINSFNVGLAAPKVQDVNDSLTVTTNIKAFNVSTYTPKFFNVSDSMTTTTNIKSFTVKVMDSTGLEIGDNSDLTNKP